MAPKKGILEFFASAKGRKFTFGLTAAAGIGAFCLKFVPHTFLVNKQREFLATYREGVERPLSEALTKRFEMVEEYLKVTDFEKRFLKPFMVAGFEAYHVGSLKYRYGALVGIPINYSYTAKNEIDRSDIIIRGKPVDWGSRGGALFEESLVLTEDEQLFGIAREMVQLRHNDILLNSLFPTASIAMVYAISTAVNSKFRLFYRPLSLRVVLYGIVYLYGFGIYSFLTDYTQVKYDTQTDETLASLGRGFVDAGIRFYDKLLKKNIACRELTNDQSEYTALGNENFLIRQKRLPLTDRKLYFETKLEELKKNEDKEKANK